MHETFAFQHLDEWLQLQIAPGWNQVFLTFGLRRPVFVPGLFIIAGTRESIANHFLDTHPSCRITSCLALRSEVRSLRVLAKRKLYSRRRTGENKILNRVAIFQFNNGVLSADCIT